MLLRQEQLLLSPLVAEMPYSRAVYDFTLFSRYALRTYYFYKDNAPFSNDEEFTVLAM